MNLQTENSFDYLYHKGYCKLTGIDLSRQTNKSIPQQINFVGKLEKDNGATMLSVSKKQEKTILNLSLDSLIVTNNIDNGTSRISKWSKWF